MIPTNEGPPQPPQNYYGVRVPPPYPSEAAQYPPPLPEYVMDTEPSQVSSRLATDQHEGGEEDEVLVIHEHHHHHHHQDEQINNGTTNASRSLLENILNDEVLYDFVSFLIEEAQSNDKNEASLSGRNDEDKESSWRRYSEPYGSYHESREEEELVRIVSSHDTKQFLNDGFTPIVEVELDK